MDVGQTQELINIVTLLALAVVGLGTAGMAGLVLVIRQNKEQAQMIWQSVPVQTQQTLRPFIQDGKQFFEAVDEIVDPPAAAANPVVAPATPPPATPPLKPEVVAAVKQEVANQIAAAQISQTAGSGGKATGASIGGASGEGLNVAG